MVMEAPGPCVAAVYSDGLAAKVALFPLMFANELRLPFCHPIRNVLDYLCLAPAQLHPNTWWILVLCCVIYRMVLGTGISVRPRGVAS